MQTSLGQSPETNASEGKDVRKNSPSDLWRTDASVTRIFIFIPFLKVSGISIPAPSFEGVVGARAGILTGVLVVNYKQPF